MNDNQKQVLFENTARAMGDAPDIIKYRHIRNCNACHPDYCACVAKSLCMTIEEDIAAHISNPAQ